MKVMAFLIICLTAACAANTLLVNNLFMYRQPDYTTPAPVVYQTNSFLIFGDSKSTPDNLQSQLEVNMNARSPVATNRWVSAPVRIANAGYSAYIYVHVADLAAILAARTTNTPTYIFLNLGANDVNGDVNDVHNFDTNGITWKTNMAFILDALHTKWASAEIYQMLPWKQGSTYSNKLWLLAIHTSRRFIPAEVGVISGLMKVCFWRTEMMGLLIFQTDCIQMLQDKT